MSRNAMDSCIDAANERDDQRETALREWAEVADTTRVHPRTLGEAFRGPEYANPIEPPERSCYPLLLWLALVLGFVVAIAAGKDWI